MDFPGSRARLVQSLSLEITDRRVLDAMLRVPREAFVPPELQQFAYDDRPLPIGYNQTISQPFIVALMTQSLLLTGKEKVLELGTGSGYQTAILAETCRLVVTVERIAELAEHARQILDLLGYRNIEFHPAEKILGWQNGAPYDAIIVTAAAPRIPEELIDQLTVGGRLVIPVGPRYTQELTRATKHADGSITTEELGACQFVSLIGEGAWEEH
ncbi:MAG TPA: protein-L-isoaspartate(D-aspartate) O-methyltransferase [Dehalococcoidales bacterium]|nr:protein-L-isoaspartate(D-aspartate) O-methyltransferase [Dehalococcoidales bacterium]